MIGVQNTQSIEGGVGEHAKSTEDKSIPQYKKKGLYEHSLSDTFFSELWPPENL